MAKYKEEAVDYNPFEQTAPKYKEEAVDYDPFAPPKPHARVAGEDEGDT
jgi:phage terminase large subunit-like protein